MLNIKWNEKSAANEGFFLFMHLLDKDIWYIYNRNTFSSPNQLITLFTQVYLINIHKLKPLLMSWSVVLYFQNRFCAACVMCHYLESGTIFEQLPLWCVFNMRLVTTLHSVLIDFSSTVFADSILLIALNE